MYLASDKHLKTAHAVAYLNAEIIVLVTKWCPVQREGGRWRGEVGHRKVGKTDTNRQKLTDRH